MITDRGQTFHHDVSPFTAVGTHMGPAQRKEIAMSSLKNVGTLDRALRIIVGLVVLSLVFFGPQTPWGWIGVVPLVTALVGYCPAYSLFGLRTCPIKA